MKKVTIIIAAIFFAVSGFARDPKAIKKIGKFNSGSSYSIAVIEKPFVKRLDSKEDDGSVWGIDGGYPMTVVETLTPDINDIAVFIPWKFYDDITNINSVKIEENEGTFILTVKGGDAAGSYRAEYKIKNYRLVERIVRVGEFPDEVWEKTILHNELLNNKDM